MTRVSELEVFLQKIENANLDQDSEFTDILADSELILNLSDIELARAIRVSRPTVNRWRSGKAIPHTIMRSGVVNFITKRAKALLKGLKTVESSRGRNGNESSGDSSPRIPTSPKVASPSC